MQDEKEPKYDIMGNSGTIVTGKIGESFGTVQEVEFIDRNSVEWARDGYLVPDVTFSKRQFVRVELNRNLDRLESVDYKLAQEAALNLVKELMRQFEIDPNELNTYNPIDIFTKL